MGGTARRAVLWRPCVSRGERRVASDGCRAVTAGGGWDSTARLWDLATGEGLRVLHGCVAGDPASHVYVLRLWNAASGPSMLTAWRGPARDALAFGCVHCRIWSEAPHSALGTEVPCPNCGKPVKLDPFVIEADWRPVAEAWRGSEEDPDPPPTGERNDG